MAEPNPPPAGLAKLPPKEEPSGRPAPAAAPSSSIAPSESGTPAAAAAPSGSRGFPPQKNPFGRPPPGPQPKLLEPSTPSPPPAPSASPPYSKWTVDAVVTAHALPAPAIPPASPLPFLHTIERLKTTPREGWRRFAIPNGESIADHMHRMALMTFLAPAQLRARGLDVDRAARMALVHDMAESLVGDITPVDGIAKADKAQREAGAMDWLCGRLLGADRAADADAPPDGDRTGARAGMAAGGAEMRELWCEYEAGTTLTARFVHDVDKVELVLQMVEYERRGKGMLDLGEFAHVIERIDLPAMREWAADAMRERAELWKQFGKDPSEADIGRKLAERALPGNAGTEE